MKHAWKRGSALILSLLMTVLLFATISGAASAKETTKVIWDMEDKAVIGQLITADAQKATMVQSTQYKRSGAASLMFVNTGHNGLMGNIVPFLDVDLTGWDIIRFYVCNPTDREAGLRYQFCGGMTGNTPYYLDVEIPAQTDGFIPVDFPLKDFEAIEYIAQGKFYDIAQPYEYVIADSALIFTGPETGERLYIDDVMLVKSNGGAATTAPTKATANTTKPVNTTKPAHTTKPAGTTAQAAPVGTTASETVDTTAADTSETAATEAEETKATVPASAETKAPEESKPQTEKSGFPVWGTVLIVVAVLAAGGTAAVMIVRKKKTDNG